MKIGVIFITDEIELFRPQIVESIKKEGMNVDTNIGNENFNTILNNALNYDTLVVVIDAEKGMNPRLYYTANKLDELGVKPIVLITNFDDIGKEIERAALLYEEALYAKNPNRIKKEDKFEKIYYSSKYDYSYEPIGDDKKGLGALIDVIKKDI